MSGDDFSARTYREFLAERIFVATIRYAEDGSPSHYSMLGRYWGEQCLRMADGFIEALIADRETEREG